METITSIEQVKPVELTEDEQNSVVKFVLECHSLGKSERATYEKGWEECKKAYDMTPPELDKSLKWQSNLFLPWSRDAVDSATAYLNQSLLPKGDQIFSLSGRTQEDHPGVEVMQKYMEHVFDENDLAEQFADVIKQACIFNHPCMKVYWREEKRQSYEWAEQQDPVTGEVKKVKTPKEITTYNNPWFDVIDLKDFVFYPVNGDIEKTTRIHETYRYLDELKTIAESGNAPYFNIDKLEDSDETAPQSVTESSPKKDEPRKPDGLNIKEAWIHRIKIGGTVYYNYVATVVDDKILIRFQPNPYEMGRSPFVFRAMNPDGRCLYGDGLLSPGLDLQKAGNDIFNMRINELRVKLYPSYKYYEDGTFNPYSFTNMPAGLVEVKDAEACAAQLTPTNPHLQHLQIAYEEVAEIKIEHENVTVPKAIKGMVEQKDTTATEINTATSNASGKLHVYATRINYLLKKLLEMAYLLIYQRMQYDTRVKEDIARVTQPRTKMVPVGQDDSGQPIMEERERPIEEMVAALPQFLPLPELDIKVVGYQNQVRKQEQLQGIQQLAAQAYQVPELAAELDGHNLLEMSAELLTLDKDRLLKDPKEKQAQDEQNAKMAQQQQDLMAAELQAKVQEQQGKAQAEMAKGANEQQKMQMDYDIELQKLELERQKLALEAQKIEQADRHAEMNAQQQQEQNKIQQDQFDKTLQANKNKDKGNAA